MPPYLDVINIGIGLGNIVVVILKMKKLVENKTQINYTRI